LNGRGEKIKKSNVKDNIEIVEVKKPSTNVIHALQRLLPQLTTNYKSFDRHDLEEILDCDNTRLFIAIDRDSENQIVGTYSLVIFRISTGKIIRIEDVIVDESRRGEGLGRTMMNHALQFAKNTGYDKIELYSHPTRIAANKLYQSMDFKIMKANVYRYKS
jgi:ribosomal protein S18 acetylase RimI-like enzyme